MVRFVNLTGQKFGRLTVIKRVENDKNGHTKWLCKCDCGNEISVLGINLKRPHTRSCGCNKGAMITKSKIKHGKTNTRIAKIFSKMKQRCYNKNNPAYKNYGGRGIKICEEWLDKENGFMNFYNWAMSNGYRDDLTIDRINNNGSYEPNNCRWATYKEQDNNKRNNHYITYNGEIHTITEWSEIIGISISGMTTRINRENIKDLIFYKGKITEKVRKKYENK